MPKNGRIAAYIESRAAFFALVASAVLVGGIPVLLSMVAPQLNNSVVIAICASGQFFVSIFAGIAWSKAQAVKEANLRWVPMAASACDRLATILGSVANLRATVGQACGSATKNLPELTLDNNRAVRVHFEGLCSSNATRLNDVESHLDSALTDWERFIKQNCEGPECADIGRRLAVLRARVLSMNCSSGAVGCGSDIVEAGGTPQETSISSEKLHLIVSGVTTDQDRNGRWSLQQIENGIWECEDYILRQAPHGWFVEDRSDAESYFYRAGTASPCGAYERCEVCPHDGNAVVFKPVRTMSDSQGKVQIQSGSTLPLSGDQTGVLNLTVALSEYIQHVVREHGVSRDDFIIAVMESSNLAEFSAMLGTGCPNIVSVCALPALNVLREALGRPPFTFDEELQNKLCQNADALHRGTSSDGENEEKQVG